LLWFGFLACGVGAVLGLVALSLGHIGPGLFLFLAACIGILNYRYDVSLSERTPPS
jgi:hypothetical protein